ncbi:hypothetical protein [uncultured Bacteroides sp.]|uniref:hypothetical protein n=1 Tax=uncultured Bacteroides sp. TaxID=162156 RepID=UPI002604E0B3|nr:hypothetical protein [uncultured Bacteroides sp.]
MMEIMKLGGTDERLYPLVGPLVMNPKVLKQNNNFPFRTAENYVWYIAGTDGHVQGFVPLEKKKNEYVVNNYYIENKSVCVLKALLEKISDDVKDDTTLAAVVLLEDVPAFKELEFSVEKEWTRYVRMKKINKK